MEELKEPIAKSLITTEAQLFALQPRQRIYVYNNHDIEFWDTMGKMPYNTMDKMLFYRGNCTLQLSIHQLNRKIFTDHDEAYRHLVYELRDTANAVVKHNLNGIE